MATDPGMLSSWYGDFMKAAPKAKEYAPAAASVTNWNVDKDQTVEGRVGGLLQQDNPLMQQAATSGLQQANKRGLINSSLGVQAGQEALYKAALPIASQDASTYGRSAEFNAGAANQASMFNANATNTAGQFNAGAANDMATNQFNVGAGMLTENQKMKWGTGEREAEQVFKTGERKGAETFQTGENTLDREQETRIQQLTESGMDTRQATQIAATERNQKADQTFTAGQREMDRAYGTAERSATQVFQAGETAMDRALTTGERVASQDFASAQAALDRAEQLRAQQLQESGMDKRQAETIASQERLQKSDQVFTSEQKTRDQLFTSLERIAIQQFENDRLDVQNTFTERLQQLQETGMNERQASSLAMQESLTKMAESGVQNRFDAQQALTSEQFSFEQAAIDRRLVQEHSNELAKMGYANELDNAKVPSSFAATTANSTMNAVNAIMGDPNLDEDAKKTAIQNVVDNGNATLRWAAAAYETAFPPIPGLDWSTAPVAGTTPAADTGPTMDGGTSYASPGDASPGGGGDAPDAGIGTTGGPGDGPNGGVW